MRIRKSGRLPDKSQRSVDKALILIEQKSKNMRDLKIAIFVASYILTFVIMFFLFTLLAPSDASLSFMEFNNHLIMAFGIFLIAPLLISWVLMHNQPLWFIVILIIYSIPVLLFILSLNDKSRKRAYLFSSLSGFVSAIICGGTSFLLMNG